MPTFLEPQTDLSNDLGGPIKTFMAGSILSHAFVHSKRLWRHVLMTSNFSCFGGFYFVSTLYRFKNKFGKPCLIFPCDRQPEVHIFEMEHNG